MPNREGEILRQNSRGRVLFVVVPGRYFVSHRMALAEAAIAEGWEVHVAAPAGSEVDEIQHPQISVHRVDLVRTVGSPSQEIGSVGALFRLCQRIRPSLIHALGPKACVVGGLVGRALGIPTVMARGGIGSPETMPGVQNAVARRVIRWGIAAGLSKHAVLIAQNEDELRNCLLFRSHRDRTEIVAGAGVDCAAFAPTEERTGPLKVVFVGRLLRSKGLADFVAAARLVRRRLSDTQFLIAGDLDVGNTASVTADEISRWQAEGDVQWLGPVADVPELLSSCHVVCLPSHSEGLPRALAEALAAGRCVVTTDAPGCRDVVEHGVNGLLVQPRAPEELSGALITLLQSPKLRAKYAASGRQRALKCFDQRVIASQYLDVYARLTTAPAIRLNNRLFRYFAKYYADRNSVIRILLLRHGEARRRQLLRNLLGNLDRNSILDVGCGDGSLLSSVISGRPRLIQIEDINKAEAAKAAARLDGRADEVIPHVTDSFSETTSFDAVISIGVLDYQIRPEASLHVLLRRTNETLIVTVPRYHTRNFIRFIWFRIIGVPFCLFSKTGAHRLATLAAGRFDLVQGPFEWFIRMDSSKTRAGYADDR